MHSPLPNPLATNTGTDPISFCPPCCPTPGPVVAAVVAWAMEREKGVLQSYISISTRIQLTEGRSLRAVPQFLFFWCFCFARLFFFGIGPVV
mmetsp:Transcript_49852/g.81505  ORF Transcript_49852/g.81505 Transcript_49852/m.81505 type:complete len:92 (+) Transcript_49852:949-1224(+)